MLLLLSLLFFFSNSPTGRRALVRANFSRPPIGTHALLCFSLYELIILGARAKKWKIASEIGKSHCKQKLQITRKWCEIRKKGNSDHFEKVRAALSENNCLGYHGKSSCDPKKCANCALYPKWGNTQRYVIRQIEQSDTVVWNWNLSTLAELDDQKLPFWGHYIGNPLLRINANYAETVRYRR